MSEGRSVSADYLDALYARDADPWRFETSDYEAQKYAATLAALPRPHYAAGLEVGCSIGVLTGMLARRCDKLTAIDPAEVALHRAQERNRHLGHIAFERRMLPRDGLSGGFDLFMLSEVLYFMSLPDLHETASLLAAHASPQADMVLVNWLPENEYAMPGDAAAKAFILALGSQATQTFETRNETYRLDVLRLR